jgi:hypothetical protein
MRRALLSALVLAALLLRSSTPDSSRDRRLSSSDGSGGDARRQPLAAAFAPLGAAATAAAQRAASWLAAYGRAFSPGHGAVRRPSDGAAAAASTPGLRRRLIDGGLPDGSAAPGAPDKPTDRPNASHGANGEAGGVLLPGHFRRQKPIPRRRRFGLQHRWQAYQCRGRPTGCKKHGTLCWISQKMGSSWL